MTAGLANAAADAVDAKVKKRLTTTISKIRAKIVKASDPALKCKKAKSLISSSRGPLRKLQKTVNHYAGKKVDAPLATSLATLAGQAATQADTVKAGLGC